MRLLLAMQPSRATGVTAHVSIIRDLGYAAAESVCVGVHQTHAVALLQGLDVILFNPLNAELNPICYLLALLGAHHFLHVSRIKVKLLTFRLLMSYIWSTHS